MPGNTISPFFTTPSFVDGFDALSSKWVLFKLSKVITELLLREEPDDTFARGNQNNSTGTRSNPQSPSIPLAVHPDLLR
jgi:hypothetical protein